MPCRAPKSVCCMGRIRPRASVDHATQEERVGWGGGGGGDHRNPLCV